MRNQENRAIEIKRGKKDKTENMTTIFKKANLAALKI